MEAKREIIKEKNKYKIVMTWVLDVCGIVLAVLISSQLLKIDNPHIFRMKNLNTLILYIVFSTSLLGIFKCYKIYFRFDKAGIIGNIFTACFIAMLPIYLIDKTFNLPKSPLFYIFNTLIISVLAVGTRYVYLLFANKYITVDKRDSDK
ncbi:hypothetical protein [Romboutsia lituseburensis]|uniref:hypothetical protein n=1 Tax=Romboutsia lituseburensis TaxID=1537 RepID=UPI00215A507E|nr:hypothetical protein [Romboutsia lituseburensis]MCR8746790.1 hypothetical protein [Romboutsia lituseburensis]